MDGGTEISNCYNTGDVDGNNCVGGIAGYITKATNLYNKGKIIGQATTVNNTYNLGKVTKSEDSDSLYVGAVVGNIWEDIVNNAYLAETYDRGIGELGGELYTDDESITKRIENIEDLYTLITRNLTEADGWILKEGEKLPTINFEEE